MCDTDKTSKMVQKGLWGRLGVSARISRAWKKDEVIPARMTNYIYIYIYTHIYIYKYVCIHKVRRLGIYIGMHIHLNWLRRAAPCAKGFPDSRLKDRIDTGGLFRVAVPHTTTATAQRSHSLRTNLASRATGSNVLLL